MLLTFLIHPRLSSRGVVFADTPFDMSLIFTLIILFAWVVSLWTLSPQASNLDQVRAWHWTGGKPWSEPVSTGFHFCISALAHLSAFNIELPPSSSMNGIFCPSVTFLTMFPSSYHHKILRSYHQGPGYRSMQKVKVTEVTTQINRFRTVTPVWLHIWWWNYTYSLMLLRRGALLFFKVIHQISRSHSIKNHQIWPRLGISRL